MLLDPIALREFEEVGLAQAPWDGEIDLVQGDGARKMSLLEPSSEALVEPASVFLLDQKRKAFVKGEVVIGGRLGLGLPSFEQSEESEVFKFLKRRRSVLSFGANWSKIRALRLP